MTARTDKTKGRAEQAVGDLIGDGDLEREGRADRAVGGGANDLIGRAKDWVEDTIDGVRDRIG